MRIDHIAMYVHHLEEARDFFIRYFGATSNDGYRNEITNFESYFLTFDDGTRIELMNKLGLLKQTEVFETARVHTVPGYSHIAFNVGSREKVDMLTQRLKEDGYEVISGPRTTGDGYYESSVVAFENNIIEITI